MVAARRANNTLSGVESLNKELPSSKVSATEAESPRAAFLALANSDNSASIGLTACDESELPAALADDGCRRRKHATIIPKQNETDFME